MRDQVQRTRRGDGKKRLPEGDEVTPGAPDLLAPVPVAGLAVRRTVEVATDTAVAPARHQHGAGCGHLGGAPTIRRKGKKGGAVDTSKVGPKIAAGHAYQKHVVEEQQFADLGVDSVAKFAKHIDDCMWDSESRTLKDGRLAYWNQASRTVIIYNPKAVDDGTCFRPRQGRSYYDGLT